MTEPRTTDKLLEAGFDHPCKDTCSGWKQGFERGVFDTQSQLTAALSAMRVLELRLKSTNKSIDPKDNAFIIELNKEALTKAAEILNSAGINL